jgi:peptide chain release factor subunit 3
VKTEKPKKDIKKKPEGVKKVTKKRDEPKDVVVVQEDLVEVDETRQPVSMVFIGHVDAGKSTISGSLMYKMGIVD